MQVACGHSGATNLSTYIREAYFWVESLAGAVKRELCIQSWYEYAVIVAMIPIDIPSNEASFASLRKNENKLNRCDSRLPESY